MVFTSFRHGSFPCCSVKSRTLRAGSRQDLAPHPRLHRPALGAGQRRRSVDFLEGQHRPGEPDEEKREEGEERPGDAVSKPCCQILKLVSATVFSLSWQVSALSWGRTLDLAKVQTSSNFEIAWRLRWGIRLVFCWASGFVSHHEIK